VIFFLVAALSETSDMLMTAGLKSNTHRTYNYAQQRYLSFCELYKLAPLPATEDVLLLYVAFLYDQGLKGSTIRVYLAAIHSLHVYLNYVYPLETLRLKLAVKGAVSHSAPPTRKFPITYTVLSKMISAITARFDYKLIVAAMCFGFFGCFRCSEFCLPDSVKFNVNDHLCVGDVVVNHKERMLSVLLKKSKSDTFSLGVSVFVGCSGGPICGFCSLVDYLGTRQLGSDGFKCPLFADFSGKALTKGYFVSVTRMSLAAIGLDTSLYSGHSYRAGAATSAGDAGFEEWEIKMLGRWNSSAYHVYLRNPRIVATFSKRLVTP
jgi:hypothetical protein